jgi:hypothetical protein
VKSIDEHATASHKALVQPPSEPDRNALHGARQRTPIRRFDDEMQMIRLHREMNEPRAETHLGGMKRAEDKPR